MSKLAALVARAEHAIRVSGLEPPVVLGPVEQTDGDGTVVVRSGDLLFRLVRDRDQEFVDIASTGRPESFVYVDDVALAFGWADVASILDRATLPDVATQIGTIGRHRDELLRSFSPNMLTASLQRIAEAQAMRAAARASRRRRNERR